MSSMEAALEELKSLKIGQRINYTKIADKHGVNRTTLSRRHRGVQNTREEQYNEQRVLNSQQAEIVINRINEMTQKGPMPTLEMLRDWAEEITGTRPGRQWPSRFLKKYNYRLIARDNNNTTITESQQKKKVDYA